MPTRASQGAVRTATLDSDHPTEAHVLTAMGMMGMMGMVAGLVNPGSVAVGWVVHLVISAAFDAGFALAAGWLASTAGRATGIGEPQIMSLMGHALYGAITGHDDGQAPARPARPLKMRAFRRAFYHGDHADIQFK